MKIRLQAGKKLRRKRSRKRSNNLTPLGRLDIKVGPLSGLGENWFSIHPVDENIVDFGEQLGFMIRFCDVSSF